MKIFQYPLVIFLMTRLNLRNRFYFLTSVIHERKKLLKDREFAQIVKEQWKHYEEEHDFNLHAYAILPDHYHALVELKGEKDISQVLYSVNSYSSKLINERLEGEEYRKIWQGDAYDVVIRSEKMYFQKLAYILFNPWRDGLIEDPFSEYQFSNLEEWFETEGKEFLEDLFSKYKRWSE
ncbi:transposase [Candidatus Bipolaricaulota bacterium]|nr:transposase [Candidatus Bipolaricaulota bacterium]